MSFFFGRKDKEKISSKNHKFYVEFLGWIESRGLIGRQYTEPVVNDLRRKQRKWKNAPKLTLQVSKKELRISQEIEEKKRKIKTIEFPRIPSRDITFVSQAINLSNGRPDDIVACIYLGYVPRTQRYVHVHVYRFDTPETASNFAKILKHFINVDTDRIRRAEMDLAGQGWIDNPQGFDSQRIEHQRYGQRRLELSDGMSDPQTSDSAPDSGAASSCSDSLPSDEIEPDLQSLRDQMAFDSVTNELKSRLNMVPVDPVQKVPILLPPKDYDTISRRQGNLEKVDLRRSLNLNIVGLGAQPRPRNGSDESGIELQSPSEEGSEFKTPSLESPITDRSFESSPVSARSAKDSIYPPQYTPRSPRSSTGLNDSLERRAPNRQQSFNSGYSGHSYRSGSSNLSNGFSENPNGSESKYTVYKGQSVADVPPADYDAPEPVQRRVNQWRSSDNVIGGRNSPANFRRDLQDLRRSVATQMMQEEDHDGPIYSVSTRNRSKSTRVNHPVSDIYVGPVSADVRVRRTHSMYK